MDVGFHQDHGSNDQNIINVDVVVTSALVGICQESQSYNFYQMK